MAALPKLTHYILILSRSNYDGLPMEEADRYRIPMNAPELKTYAVLLGKDPEAHDKWETEAKKKLTDQKVVSKHTKKIGDYYPGEIWNVIRKDHPKETDWDECDKLLEKYKIDNSSDTFTVKPTDCVWLFTMS